MLIMMVVMFGELVGCSLTTTSTTNEITTSSITSATKPIKTGENQSREELIEWFDYYKTRLTEMDEKPSVEVSTEQNPSVSEIEDEEKVIPRVDLPAEKSPNINETVITNKLNQLISKLDDLLNYIESCSVLEENVLCSIDIPFQNRKIRITSIGDTLTVEEYAYGSSSLYDPSKIYVNSQIYRFDLIDGLMRFDYLDDHRSQDDQVSSRSLSTIIVIEPGIYYEGWFVPSINSIYDFTYGNAETGDYFEYSSDSNEYAIHISDVVRDRSITVSFNNENDITRIALGYGRFQRELVYIINNTSLGQRISIAWNLYRVSGWDAMTVIYGSALNILKNNEPVLSDDCFRLNTYITPEYATLVVAGLFYSTEFDASVFDLTAYGLLYNQISYEQVNMDLSLAPTEVLSAREQHGFTADHLKNQAIIEALITLSVDEEVIESLWD